MMAVAGEDESSGDQFLRSLGSGTQDITEDSLRLLGTTNERRPQRRLSTARNQRGKSSKQANSSVRERVPEFRSRLPRSCAAAEDDLPYLPRERAPEVRGGRR
ncbi:hypothetical protein NL676_039601 [Syzygium grande]|nr:hypothetical protein NL676_039601 [Syzygium grande]